MDGQSSTWHGQTALVTGCTGFLGKAVVRELLDGGARVVGVLDDRSAGAAFARDRDAGRFHVVHGRPDNVFCLYTALAVHEASVIFHLTEECGEAAAGPHPAAIAAERDLAAVLRAGAMRDRYLPVVVARPIGVQTFLGSIGGGLSPHGIARFGELFGGDPHQTHLGDRTISAAIAGKSFESGEPSPRDWVFVRDAARACLAVAAEAGAGTSLDVAFRTGWEMTADQFARAVCQVEHGQPLELVFRPTPSNPFGWQPDQSLEAALRESIDWYRAASRLQTRTPYLRSWRAAA